MVQRCRYVIRNPFDMIATMVCHRYERSFLTHLLWPNPFQGHPFAAVFVLPLEHWNNLLQALVRCYATTFVGDSFSSDRAAVTYDLLNSVPGILVLLVLRACIKCICAGVTTKIGVGRRV
jgi:hypothetical protein